MDKKRCNNCKFFMTQDTGYSNYTVMETTVDCIKKANQYFPCDESYSWEYEPKKEFKELQVAENCSHYKKGEGIHFDVDGEITIEDYKNDTELVEAYNKFNKSNPTP